MKMVCAQARRQPWRCCSLTRSDKESQPSSYLHNSSTSPWSNKCQIHSKRPNTKPRQIDYILCSKRWCTSVHSSRVKWDISIQRWGRKYDHGLVECWWKAKISSPCIKPKPDFQALKDTTVAQRFNDTVATELANSELVPADDPTERLNRLNAATRKAIDTLPPIR